MKCLSKAVAVNSDTSEVVVATRFWQRIGIDLLRGSCRAFRRRLVDQEGGFESAGRAMGSVTGLAVTGQY